MLRKDYNPMNDYLFKFIFGHEERKEITLSFLNAVLGLEGEKELTDIQFMDREFDPLFDDGKLSRLDIYGIASDGSRINIEVQVVNWHNMQRRTLYYWARIYGTGIIRGKDYKELHRTITINLLNFNLLPQPEAHSVYGIYNKATGHRLTDDLEIHFLEIPKVRSQSVREMRRLDRWMAYFANNLNEKEMEELAMSDTAIRTALQAQEQFMQDEIERRKYNLREDAIRDYNWGLSSSREAGLQEGITKGREEGRAEGKAEGEEKMVRAFLAAGASMEMIKKATGWTEEQILKLQ